MTEPGPSVTSTPEPRESDAGASAATPESQALLEDNVSQAEYRTRRLRDIAVLVPVIGAFLLLSPAVRLFAQPVEILGAPLIAVYICGVWLGLIGAAWGLSRIMPAPPTK